MQKIFDHVLEMPSISKVVQELIESFNDPRANVDAVAKKIRMDQALSAKVLRLANSARYGTGRKVASIDSAVVMLGFDALRTLVVASGVTGAFRKVPHLDMKEYWRETFLVASVCKSIAKHAGLDAETAFTCGLMHSVGEVLLYLADGETMSRIDALVREGANRVDLERNQLGFDYAQVGEELAKRWNFPDRITHAVGQHTSLSSVKEIDPYALVIYLACYLAKARLKNVPKQQILSEFPTELAAPLNMNMVALMEEMDRLLAQEDDIDQVLAA
jgi:HD-like signal output (HDOD) protein